MGVLVLPVDQWCFFEQLGHGCLLQLRRVHQRLLGVVARESHNQRDQEHQGQDEQEAPVLTAEPQTCNDQGTVG